MRLTLVLVALVCLACNRPSDGTAVQPALRDEVRQDRPLPPSRPAQQKPQPTFRTAGTTFVGPTDQLFHWRGITAFRLAEFIATGREAQVATYLDWATSQRLTVVRVLLTAQHLFKLSPELGLKALPRLLDLAQARGLAVEAVALADTDGVSLDYDAYIREVGRIAAEKGNAFVEIANEPGHPTQDRRLHDPAFVKRLAALVPERVAVALGSAEYAEGYTAGDYVTFHFPRGTRDWDHVYNLAKGASLVERVKKPVVSDEPIGAAAAFQPGRRDNDPARFAAAAVLTRLAGMGATFHYEGGLQGQIPTGREVECLAAWRKGLALLDGVPLDGAFLEGDRLTDIANISGARAFARVSGSRATLLVLNAGRGASVKWKVGWKEVGRTAVPGVLLVTAKR